MPHKHNRLVYLLLALICLLVATLPVAAQPPTPAPQVETTTAAQPASISFFGMNTYFTGLERNRRDGATGVNALIAEGRTLGVAWGREEMSWGNLERNGKGQWSWNPFDERIRTAAEAGYGLIGMLLTTPAWARVPDCEARINRYAAAGVTTQDYWCPPANPQDFADYVRTVVERYDGDGVNDAPGSPRIAVWQIGNEPNAWETWPGSPAEFADMALAGYAAAKAADPTAIVAMGGLYVFDGAWDDGIGHQDGLRFLDQALAARPALWGAFDALAIHPYMPDVAPDQPGIYGQVTYWGRLATARRWLDDRTPVYGGPPKPLWISEVGWSTCTAAEADCFVGGGAAQVAAAPDAPPARAYYPPASTAGPAGAQPAAELAALIGKTEQQQADYLVRAHAMAMAQGIQHLSWFQLEDKFDGSARNFWEEAAILRTSGEGYARKPAATAYAVLTALLNGAQFSGFGPLHTFAYVPTTGAAPARFHLRFTTPRGEIVDLLWRNSGAETLGLPLEANRSAKLYNRDGAVLAELAAGATASLAVGETPIYLVQAPLNTLSVAPTRPGLLAAPNDPPIPFSLTVRNSGAGSITWSAAVDAAWVRVETPSGTGQISQMRLTITPAGLTPGSYTTTVRVRSPAGNRDIPLTLLVREDLQRTYLPVFR
jgi:hypothetical protein